MNGTGGERERGQQQQKDRRKIDVGWGLFKDAADRNVETCHSQELFA